MRACQSGTATPPFPDKARHNNVAYSKKRGPSRSHGKTCEKAQFAARTGQTGGWDMEKPSNSMGRGHGHALEPSGWGIMHARGVLLVPQPTECQGSAAVSILLYCVPFLLGHVLCCSECLHCFASAHAARLSVAAPVKAADAGSGKREAAGACVFVCAQPCAALHVCTVAYSVL